MNIWKSQTSWAAPGPGGCQDELGTVTIAGVSKPLFENTDNSGLPDIFDGDNDNDGIPDGQDSMIEDSDPVGDPDYGIPDWHPKSKHKQ